MAHERTAALEGAADAIGELPRGETANVLYRLESQLAEVREEAAELQDEADLAQWKRKNLEMIMELEVLRAKESA